MLESSPQTSFTTAVPRVTATVPPYLWKKIGDD